MDEEADADQGHRLRPRIGVIGYGFIGQGLVSRALAPGSPVELAFVHARRAPILPGLVLDDLADAASLAPDLVVEAAHPVYTAEWGEQILGYASYAPLSTTALADDALRATLHERALSSGHRLVLAHGALVGVESLLEVEWADVRITFEKHPASIDFSLCPALAAPSGRRTVYAGPVRGIAELFPRNVNAMVTCALATVGLDRCEARLIADPGLRHGLLEVVATGHDGSELVIRRRQPMRGVSGTEMLDSVWGSVLRASGVAGATAFA